MPPKKYPPIKAASLFILMIAATTFIVVLLKNLLQINTLPSKFILAIILFGFYYLSWKWFARILDKNKNN